MHWKIIDKRLMAKIFQEVELTWQFPVIVPKCFVGVVVVSCTRLRSPLWKE